MLDRIIRLKLLLYLSNVRRNVRVPISLYSLASSRDETAPGEIACATVRRSRERDAKDNGHQVGNVVKPLRPSAGTAYSRSSAGVP